MVVPEEKAIEMMGGIGLFTQRTISEQIYNQVNTTKEMSRFSPTEAVVKEKNRKNVELLTILETNA